MSDCLFCRIIRKELPSQVVYEDDHSIAFLDIHPDAPGHTLLVPKEHADTFLANSPAALHHLVETAQRLAPQIMKNVGADGMQLKVNIGKTAGQVIFHTHLHLVPCFAQNDPVLTSSSSSL